MLYVTGVHALNMMVEGDETPGDWHRDALDWSEPRTRESSSSVFGDWGISEGRLPNGRVVPAANHVRACLDLLEMGKYSSARQMRDSYLDDESLTATVFEKVSMLRASPSWGGVDAFMGSEYLCDWLDYKERAGL